MIFAGGEPRVRTEGFDICVANVNLPQRSPNMKRPYGSFFMFDYFHEIADIDDILIGFYFFINFSDNIAIVFKEFCVILADTCFLHIYYK